MLTVLVLCMIDRLRLDESTIGPIMYGHLILCVLVCSLLNDLVKWHGAAGSFRLLRVSMCSCLWLT